jgi:hypothetical protein
MKIKIIPLIGVITMGILFMGLFFSDPNGSRSNITENDALNPVVIQTNSVEKYVDAFDGANDSTSLKNRGYKIRRGALMGPPGTNNGWFQGNATVFPAFNGPTTGYVAANFNTVSGANTIDLWLISPIINAVAGDTISFYERSPAASGFPDSIRVHWASNADTMASTGSWVELGKFKTTTTGSWAERRFVIPSTANGRLAINYRVVNGGPSGVNSDYIGIDYLRVLGPAAPPVVCSYSGAPQVSGTTAGFFSVKTVNDMVAWAAAAGAVVRRTTDGGVTWGNGNPNPGVIVGDIYNIEAIDANTAWVTTSGASTFIYKTTNGGGTWVQVFSQAGGFINAIKMVSATNGYAFGDPVAGNWVLLTTVNGGTTWTDLSTPAGTGDGRNNCAQVMLPNMWFGTGQGTVVRSTNGGINWVTTTVTGITGQILGIKFNSPTLGLLGGATLSRTTDGGATWAAVTVPGTGNITGIDGSGNEFFLVRGTGIYRSTDGGLTFVSVHTAVGTQNDLKITNGPNGCFVGWSVASAGNITKLVGVPVGIVINNNEIPDNYSLLQNYPNPFNPTTNIKFSLPNTGLVKLVVFDVLGREVATLVNEVKSAGNYTADFDASTLSSGVYFYRLESGNFTETKKMLLVK